MYYQDHNRAFGGISETKIDLPIKTLGCPGRTLGDLKKYRCSEVSDWRTLWLSPTFNVNRGRLGDMANPGSMGFE